MAKGNFKSTMQNVAATAVALTAIDAAVTAGTHYVFTKENYKALVESRIRNDLGNQSWVKDSEERREAIENGKTNWIWL